MYIKHYRSSWIRNLTKSMKIRSPQILTIKPYSVDTPISIMPHYPPSGERWGFELCKILIGHTIWSNPNLLPHSKNQAKDGHLTAGVINYSILLYMCMVSSQIPHMWGKFWCQYRLMPPLFPGRGC